MKLHPFYFLAFLSVSAFSAEEEKMSKEEALKKHAAGAEKLAEDQDELSATVQQIVMEQTQPQVIQLLGEVENIMDEATEYLLEPDTGGRTIAAQTEIIEKIHQAAKKRKQESGQTEAGSAMMDMMERMMGKKDGEGKKKNKGDKGDNGEGGEKGKAGDKGGKGDTGDSNSDNDAINGLSSGNKEERRVPKASGQAGKNLPSEFQSALDAYNRGMEELGK